MFCSNYFCASILTALLEYLELKAFPLKGVPWNPLNLPLLLVLNLFVFSYNEL